MKVTWPQSPSQPATEPGLWPPQFLSPFPSLHQKTVALQVLKILGVSKEKAEELPGSFPEGNSRRRTAWGEINPSDRTKAKMGT